jgi:hypothetical protein
MDGKDIILSAKELLEGLEGPSAEFKQVFGRIFFS